MRYGVDLGGTKLAVGTPDGLRHVVPTPATAAGIVAAVAALTPGASRLGVCVAGRVDPHRGQTAAANLPQLAGFPLARALSDRAVRAGEPGPGRLPVALLNDADAAALAEHRLGAGRGAPSSLYVTVSTGIGAGLVTGEQWFRGALELGHTRGGPPGQPCACGRRGCVELAASGTAITRAARLTLNDPDASPGALAARAQAGDLRVLGVLGAAAAALAPALADACLLLDPAVLVLGGGVCTGYGELYLTPLRRALDAALDPWPRPELRAAQLGPDAGLLGALLASDPASV